MVLRAPKFAAASQAWSIAAREGSTAVPFPPPCIFEIIGEIHDFCQIPAKKPAILIALACGWFRLYADAPYAGLSPASRLDFAHRLKYDLQKQFRGQIF